MTFYAIDHELNKHKQSIRDFCRHKNGTSGVLFITGPRGIGKTRLVDEALNNRQGDIKRSWYEGLFGEDKDQCRIELTDIQPRGQNRTVVKIEVEPFFPHGYQSSISGNADDDKQNKRELATFQLIRNIVFALTSNLDPRFSTRKHGKTLLTKLGVKEYFFARNALLPRLSFLARILFYIYLFLVVFLSLNDIAFTLPIGCNEFFSFLILNGLNFSFFLVAFVFLRCLDLWGLHKTSAKLYDLVHAQDIKKNSEFGSELNTRINNLWIIPIVLLIGAFSFDLVEGLKQVLKEYQPFIKGGFLAGVLITSLNITQKQKIQVQFSQDNPIWMLTLLKRYLFMLHRCGIEPVLVFDELDKLDQIDVKEQVNENKDQSGELDCFIDVLLRLKHSLGSYSNIILIGNIHLYQKLQEDRHNQKLTLGKLSTLIRRDIVLGAMSYEVANKYLDDKQIQNSDIELKKTYWLRSHGNFSTLIRSLDYQINFSPDEKEDSAYLTDCINRLWQSRMQQAVLGSN